MQKILFITTNNLTTNPRLLKEVQLALDNGFLPTVVCFDFDNWTTAIENDLRSEFIGVEFISIPASRESFFSWATTSVLHFFYRRLFKVLGYSLKGHAFASEKRSISLIHKLNELDSIYSFIISHNLGALFPAYFFAKKKKIPFAFDVEDFHPGEKIGKDYKNEKSRRIFLLQKLLPSASYISYASPLIGDAILNLIPTLSQRTYFLLNNSFSSKEFNLPEAVETNKLNFVWFSQNIAEGRGLEAFIPILYEFKDDVELTLVGNLNENFNNSFIKKYSEIISFIKPLPQASLHRLLSKFDVGLAIESESTDYNRDICLTNKIFAYAQAGLYVLATNTKGQTQFIEQNPWSGKLIGNTSNEFRYAIKYLIEKKCYIRNGSLERFGKSKKLSWENEQTILVNIWKSLAKMERN
jgi:hypothetical protein